MKTLIFFQFLATVFLLSITKANDFTKHEHHWCGIKYNHNFDTIGPAKEECLKDVHCIGIHVQDGEEKLGNICLCRGNKEKDILLESDGNGKSYVLVKNVDHSSDYDNSMIHVSDQFTKYEHHWCQKKYEHVFETIDSAKDACLNDIHCLGIHVQDGEEKIGNICLCQGGVNEDILLESEGAGCSYVLIKNHCK